jgi:3-dehydroquinate dehydratase-2
MKIAIVNGPNLNLLGSREKEIYGAELFESTIERLSALYTDIEILYFQSNIEGEIIDHLHKISDSVEGIVLNAGGYTHTSVSIADCVRSIKTKVVEVHISNILAREDFRHISLISPACVGSIFGFGTDGYRLAIEYFRK